MQKSELNQRAAGQVRHGPFGLAELSQLIRQFASLGPITRGAMRHTAQQLNLSINELLLLYECQLQSDHVVLDQRELARRMGVSPAQMSQLVERLGEQGLIEGQRWPSDRRRQVWRTTSRGEQRLDAMSEAWPEIRQELARRLTGGDLRRLAELSASLAQAIDSVLCTEVRANERESAA